VALVILCRAVRADGSLGGYRLALRVRLSSSHAIGGELTEAY
jgi:hypothetical protein